LWSKTGAGDVTAIAATSPIVVTGDDDGTVARYTVDDTRQTQTQTTRRGGVELSAVAISPDATVRAAGGLDGQVTAVVDGEERTLGVHGAAVTAVGLSADDAGGLIAITGSVDRTVRVWSLRDDSYSVIDTATGPVRAVHAFTKGQRMLIAPEASSVHLWPVATATGAVKMRRFVDGLSDVPPVDTSRAR
jgi:WD40 repeat protein